MDISGIGSVADLAKDVLDKIFPDPAQKSAAQLALLQAQQAGTFKQMDQEFNLAIEQIRTNAAEAAQPGLHFRDGAGWICVVGLAVSLLKAPMEWGFAIAGHPVTLPEVDTSVTTTMLLGLLGLGGMHMTEKVKGVA